MGNNALKTLINILMQNKSVVIHNDQIFEIDTHGKPLKTDQKNNQKFSRKLLNI